MATADKNQGAKRAPFAVVEAYNTIRANLLFLLSARKEKIFTVSSCTAHEGKSTTAINTAIAFSQMGKKILLIDADMRKSSIHKTMHLSNSKGLSSLLVGFCEIDEIINNINPYLDVLTAGPTPPNPSELLASKEFNALLDNLKEKYDYILIDTPPIGIVSDALLIAPHTGGIVLVIKSRETTHNALKHTVSSIEFAKIKLLGVILNQTEPEPKLSKKKVYSYYNYK